MTDPVFNRIAIIGTGLLGASIAHAVSAYGGAAQVAMFDGDAAARDLAGKIVPGQVSQTLQDAAENADAVFLCTPVGVFGEITASIAPFLKPGSILTDVGSVKSRAYDDMRAACPDNVHLIPGHPIAGPRNPARMPGLPACFGTPGIS